MIRQQVLFLLSLVSSLSLCFLTSAVLKSQFPLDVDENETGLPVLGPWLSPTVMSGWRSLDVDCSSFASSRQSVTWSTFPGVSYDSICCVDSWSY